ncbi:hypothetical protein M885DRAFT_519908 [Pelagophyceae sp. CCMP2097]|nr:hypothetical protein M885DRAFT_519908 [Pelagophyceae sp. CCMP2097]|mmetsp:Transcript_2449/g.8905  ORF Transcript_2449/g.8905 Transcript_2449/m.8905 type:complete len:186 (-) Transcript_2449:84-641(-)
MRRLGLAALIASALAVDVCPGSASAVHSQVKVTTSFEGFACSVVKAEMLARIQAQDGWADPRGGSFDLVSETDAGSDEEGTRTTLVAKRTDDGMEDIAAFYYKETNIDFPVSSKTHPRGCVITACAERQVRSYDDASANYCNVRNLYAGRVDGMAPVRTDFMYSEVVDSFIYASTDLTKCSSPVI